MNGRKGVVLLCASKRGGRRDRRGERRGGERQKRSKKDPKKRPRRIKVKKQKNIEKRDMHKYIKRYNTGTHRHTAHTLTDTHRYKYILAHRGRGGSPVGKKEIRGKKERKKEKRESFCSVSPFRGRL